MEQLQRAIENANIANYVKVENDGINYTLNISYWKVSLTEDFSFLYEDEYYTIPKGTSFIYKDNDDEDPTESFEYNRFAARELVYGLDLKTNLSDYKEESEEGEE